MRRIVKIYFDVPNAYAGHLPEYVTEALASYKPAAHLMDVHKTREIIEVKLQEPKVYG